jgi:hypothetical protein
MGPQYCRLRMVDSRGLAQGGLFYCPCFDVYPDWIPGAGSQVGILVVVAMLFERVEVLEDLRSLQPTERDPYRGKGRSWPAIRVNIVFKGDF